MSAPGLSWSDLTSYIQYIADVGVAGVWIVSWLKGWIVSPREVDLVSHDRDEWKLLYTQERDAHERTRDALRLASERGESTTEALQLVAGVMNAVRVRAGYEEHDLPEAPRARNTSKRARASEDGRRSVNPASERGLEGTK